MSVNAFSGIFTNASAFFAVFVIICSICCAEDDPLVALTSGKVKGFVDKSYGGRNYFSFRGIPFAKPPIGPLRFKPPEKVDPWPDIFDATQIGRECPQMSMFVEKPKYTGDEDCLNLNVYTPNLPSGEVQSELPVLVFIHGGAFALGSSNPAWYGPLHLLDHDLILVTINYRLGVLGFLNSEDEASPGNYGMLDQVLALKWVQENVAKFSGDPTKVLIFGESAGGASILYHYISPLSQGLFSAALSQSGSPFNPWAFQERPFHWAKKLSKVVGCPTDSKSNMVKCLAQKSAEELILGGNELTDKTVFPMVFSPSVQKYGNNRFLPEEPSALFMKSASKVPIILGMTSSEGYIASLAWTSLFDSIGENNFEKAFSEVISTKLPVDPDLARPIISKYFSDINMNDRAQFEDRLALFASDYLFDAGIVDAMDFLSDSATPAFTYEYSYVGDHSLTEIFGLPERKNFTTHGDDIFVHFGYFMNPSERMSESDKVMSDMLINTWLDFVKNGKPTITANGEVIQWPKYDKDSPNYMDLNLNPKMKTGKLCHTVNFWSTEILKIREVINDMKGIVDDFVENKQEQKTKHKTEL